ncbi:MAG TPA: FUSC family protein, partial [Paraburkholderia sp.]|nr:FUSC family protein [Paraburkholderia sp.]
MIAIAFSRVADRLLVADPGIVRFKTALRSALACLLTGLVSIGWTIGHHSPPTLAAPAILIAMVAPLFLRDARLVAWLTSLLSIWLCASVSFVVAASLAPYPLAGDAGFLVLLFVGILVQACGPRALGSAMLSVVTFYLGLYLHPSEAHVAPMVALSLTAPAMVVLVGRLIVPMQPRTTLRLAIHTITLRAERVLAAQDARHHDAHLSSLNEAALALEEQLTLLNPPHADALRERLVDVEIAAGQRMFDASSAADMAIRTEALRQAIARLKANGRAGLAKKHAHPPVRTLAVRFADMRTKLSWLPALRATTAALLAMLLGHSVSPERWFWAVITTFVVFLGTRSRADTVYRGAQRLAGTFAGALVSALLIVCLRDAPAALVAVMVLSVFGWAYFILNAYAPGVFFVTELVGLVYGALGFAIGPLVEMRVEEVLVGCLVSFAVAILMMPLSATRHVETRLVAVLVDLRHVVRLAIGTA